MNLRPLPPQGSALPAAPHPDHRDSHHSLTIIARADGFVNTFLKKMQTFLSFFRKIEVLIIFVTIRWSDGEDVCENSAKISAIFLVVMAFEAEYWVRLMVVHKDIRSMTPMIVTVLKDRSDL